MRTLMWFRTDLRLADNPALYHACSPALSPRGVVAVFTICPTQWKDAHDWAPIKVEFIRRTLEQLKSDLWTRNIPLKIITEATFDGVPEALLGLAQKHDCTTLVFNREYEINEVERDAAVHDLFVDHGLDVRGFTDQVVIPPGAVRTGDGGYYSVFTPFKKRWLSMVEDRGMPRVLPVPKRLDVRALPGGDDVPDSIKGFSCGSFPARQWPSGEEAARKRLKQFAANRIDSYGDDRDRPDIDGTSQLSPYLAIGAISVRQCLEAAIEANGGALNGRKTGAAVWISELIWREFYRHVMTGWPRVCKHEPFKLDTRKLTWRSSDKDFEAWCEGRTGVPIVDAAMRQLNTIGWMHNRLRMIAAMYLTKNLFIDWRRGEQYFMQHLIDGDLGSNNGGWQWSASTGTDAAPYFRMFNPYTQSKKCDPEAKFIKQWVEELRDVPTDQVHDPTVWDDDLIASLDYPRPIVDHSESRERVLEAFKALS